MRYEVEGLSNVAILLTASSILTVHCLISYISKIFVYIIGRIGCCAEQRGEQLILFLELVPREGHVLAAEISVSTGLEPTTQRGRPFGHL